MLLYLAWHVWISRGRPGSINKEYCCINHEIARGLLGMVAELFRIPSHKKCRDQQITSTSTVSTGNLLNLKFLVTRYAERFCTTKCMWRSWLYKSKLFVNNAPRRQCFTREINSGIKCS